MSGDIHADVPAQRQTGILLVGHGTHSAQGIEEFRQIAGHVARLAAHLIVEHSFLEICQPTIQGGLGRLVERGVEHVVVAPLLLFAAGHAKRDIPQAVADALAALGVADCVTSVIAAHLGCHDSILELSRLRFAESLQGRDTVPPGKTCFLVVGRGSPDESATAEMQEFARLRAKLTPVAETHVAFLAMAQPAVGNILPRLAAGNWRRIVVQPHLLLHGELYESLLAQVANMSPDQCVREWVVTSYLAGSSALDSAGQELISRAVLARVTAAGRGAGIRVVAPFAGR